MEGGTTGAVAVLREGLAGLALPGASKWHDRGGRDHEGSHSARRVLRCEPPLPRTHETARRGARRGASPRSGAKSTEPRGHGTVGTLINMEGGQPFGSMR